MQRAGFNDCFRGGTRRKRTPFWCTEGLLPSSSSSGASKILLLLLLQAALLQTAYAYQKRPPLFKMHFHLAGATHVHASVRAFVSAQGHSMLTRQAIVRKRPIRIWIDGCYDLTHFGHYNAFRQAKALGDHLIVGLNPDIEVWLPARERGRGGEEA